MLTFVLNGINSMKKLLPIGTVVLLDGGSKKVMIYGKDVIKQDTNEHYDYLACLYPEGYLGTDYNIFFDHEFIVRIY